MEQISITKDNVDIFRLQVRIELIQYAELCKVREAFLGDKSSKAFKSFVSGMEAAEQRIILIINKLLQFYGYRNKCYTIQWFKTVGVKLIFRHAEQARKNWLCQEIAGGERHVG